MGEGAAVKDADGPLAPAKAALLALLFVGVAAGCGTIGPPIPPEEIGIAARLEHEKEKEKARKAAEEPEAVPEPEEDVPDDVMQPLVLPR